MSSLEREDDFEQRRQHLAKLSDDALHEKFWQLVNKVAEPLIEEARSHTTPAIERSVLLRMGFSSVEAKGLVEQMRQRGLLGHGAGRLVLELARQRGTTVTEAGEALLKGEGWEVLPR
jgi:D-ornithine 4,5-aminomutase subunit alpha